MNRMGVFVAFLSAALCALFLAGPSAAQYRKVNPAAVPPPTEAGHPPPLSPEGLPTTGMADQEMVDTWMHLTHGVASGDVTSHGAVIWTRASVPSLAHVQIDSDSTFVHPQLMSQPVAALEAEDYTTSINVDGLQPDTHYFYRVWLTRSDTEQAFSSRPKTGSFTTAPDSTQSAPLSFVWSGELGGDGYCRKAGEGYKIFDGMRNLRPAFFLAVGNMIYADGSCPVLGPGAAGTWENNPGDFPSLDDPAISWEDAARVRDIYWRRWRYNRADEHLKRFLAQTPVFYQVGGHDVLRDPGGSWIAGNGSGRFRPGYQQEVAEGLDAFFQYAPIRRDPESPNRSYRSFRWGKDAEFFLLDTHSYRKEGKGSDTPPETVTVLGAEQLAWLRQGLLRSRATWKIVSCDLPISQAMPPAGPARDAWIRGGKPSNEGFEDELRGLLSDLDAARVGNLVFLTTGRHYPTEIRYSENFNGDDYSLVFYELSVGPLSARMDAPSPLDPTFLPTVLYSDGNLFNFGYIRIDPGAGGAHLKAEVVGEDGKVRPGSALDLMPSQPSTAVVMPG